MMLASASEQPLVSIVIPCYNTKKWVQRCVQSALDQTYANVEIIVVDDGSTDGSLQALQRFLPNIKLEIGPNRGGNVARNRGFALSVGKYIQFLDADDYLEPGTIARQVDALEETGADAVYGDWRYRRHLLDSRLSYLEGVTVGRIGEDILASALSGDYPPTGAVLYDRRIVELVGGWDETLRAAQDREFFTSVVLSGAKIVYKPGCCYNYRQYGAVTVSTSNLDRWVQAHSASLIKAKMTLLSSNRLTERYTAALAYGHFEIARGSTWTSDPQLSFKGYARILGYLANKILELEPRFIPKDESLFFKLVVRLFGLRSAMKLFWGRLAIRRMRAKLKYPFLQSWILHRRGVVLLRENDIREDAFG